MPGEDSRSVPRAAEDHRKIINPLGRAERSTKFSVRQSVRIFWICPEWYHTFLVPKTKPIRSSLVLSKMGPKTEQKKDRKQRQSWESKK